MGKYSYTASNIAPLTNSHNILYIIITKQFKMSTKFGFHTLHHLMLLLTNTVT